MNGQDWMTRKEIAGVRGVLERRVRDGDMSPSFPAYTTECLLRMADTLWDRQEAELRLRGQCQAILTGRYYYARCYQTLGHDGPHMYETDKRPVWWKRPFALKALLVVLVVGALALSRFAPEWARWLGLI